MEPLKAKQPAGRLKLRTTEKVDAVVTAPSVKLKRLGSDGKKSIISIEFSLNEIGDIVEDSDAAVDPIIEKEYRDAILEKSNFVVPGYMTARFEAEDLQGDSTLTLRIVLDTKIPGTGPKVSEEDKTKQEVDKSKK